MSDLGSNGQSRCLPPGILEQFVSGTLPAEEDEKVKRHLEACPICTANLAGDETDSEIERLLLVPSESPIVSPQEADEILRKIKRRTRTGAAGRGADRRFRFTEREIAVGGMGIIHEGVDTEMGRSVAVKRLNDEHAADPRNIEQFEHEARVTGLLEHPGIVPVYGRGTDPGGRPFYAMRMVEGERLLTAIGRLHEAPGDPLKSPGLRRLLSRFVTVCNTVAYAHKRGFAHLDLKPSNILLGPFGETFTMDWGLVMEVDRPVRGSAGTACYMSPEQVEGRFDEVGPASDIYALGGVLHTILTGRRPSRHENPSAPRDARGIARPLDAIRRKAMNHRPEQRYTSPLALAEDVERWLADEPVSVLPDTRVDRAARWMRRHRSATLAILLILASISVAAIVTTVVVSRASAAERRALLLAESRADLAVEAVGKFREAVDDNLDLRNRPDQAGLRKKLLGEPLKFYEKLREDLQKGGDLRPSTTLKLGKASLELANLLYEIDSKPGAVRTYQEAVATLGPLADLPGVPGDRDRAEAQALLVEALGRLGLAQRDLGKVDEARASLRRALGISARLAREDSQPGDPVVRARTLGRLALVEAPESPEMAISLQEEAIALLRPIAGQRLVLPADPDLLALIYTQSGTSLKALGRRSEAAERIQESIAAYKALLRSSPGNRNYRSNLATAYYNLANLQHGIKAASIYQANFERARDLWEELVRDFPSATSYRAHLVPTYGMLGLLHQDAGRLQETRAALNRSREIGEGLVREHPIVLIYRSDLCKTYINLSSLETRAGRHNESVALLGPAREHLREVLRSWPGDGSARDAVAAACVDLAGGLLALNRVTEALEAYREGVSLEMEPLRAKDSRFPPKRDILGRGLLGIARCHLQLGRVEEAARAAEEWRALWNGDPEELCSVARELAQCSAATADPAGARRHADRAMDLLREAVATGLRDPVRLRTDSSLNPLRTRADFRELLADSGFPADPFAH